MEGQKLNGVEMIADGSSNEIAVVPRHIEDDRRRKRQSVITGFFRKAK